MKATGASGVSGGKTLRVAIVGAGGISGAHSGAISASGGRLALTAVVDPHAENRGKLADKHSARGYESVEKMLAAMAAGEVAIDAAVVCTPPSARVDIVSACLKSGVHVLSEKPLAHTLADARRLSAIAARSSRTVARVAFCHRFTPAVLKMRELAAAGRIGRVVRFENAFACDLPGHKDKWFSDPKKAGGGAYLDMGSHSIDLFHFMIGPSRTLGASFVHKWPRRTETAATVLVESVSASRGAGKHVKAGVAGSIVSGWAETCRFTLALIGDGGMLQYDYEKPTELVFKELSGKAETIAVETHEVRFARQLVAFAEAVQSKRKTDLATFEDGVLAAVAYEGAAKQAG
ncbi:MAG: Gfo/Idh/MocA family protein [Phycisphaerales bacterium]